MSILLLSLTSSHNCLRIKNGEVLWEIGRFVLGPLAGNSHFIRQSTPHITVQELLTV